MSVVARFRSSIPYHWQAASKWLSEGMPVIDKSKPVDIQAKEKTREDKRRAWSRDEEQ